MYRIYSFVWEIWLIARAGIFCLLVNYPQLCDKEMKKYSL